MSPNLSLRVITIWVIAPTITAFAFDFLVLSIWRRRNEAARIRSLQIENAQFIEERRIYALDAVELMRESVSKKTAAEEVKNGLVIIQVLYGKLPPSKLVQSRLLSPQGIKDTHILLSGILSKRDEYENCIDCTVAIQALVSNGQLHIAGGFSKSQIIGIYDCCFGEIKQLRITYKFNGIVHQVQVEDFAGCDMPMRDHIV